MHLQKDVDPLVVFIPCPQLSTRAHPSVGNTPGFRYGRIAERTPGPAITSKRMGAYTRRSVGSHSSMTKSAVHQLVCQDRDPNRLEVRVDVSMPSGYTRVEIGLDPLEASTFARLPQPRAEGCPLRGRDAWCFLLTSMMIEQQRGLS